MAFNPKYVITHKILNNLTAITSAREVIEQAHLIPKWETQLRRQALLRNTHSSTAIEGNKLNFEQIEALSQGKHVIATNKDKQEVLNYIEALEKIPSFTKKRKTKVADLLNIHRILTKNVIQNAADSGVFRNRQVFVGKRIFDGTTFKEAVEYMPPKTEEVPHLTHDFIGWLNLDKTWEIHPVLLAAIAHYEIARIHPFIDGNGRTARLLATLILHLSDFDYRRIFALDDYYDRDRQAYYAALKTAQQNKGDITKWLEYFTEGVAYSVGEAKDTVLKIGIRKQGENKAQIALTPKQIEIIEHININGKVTNKDLQGLFKISAQAVHKELVKLVGLRVIKTVGKGRALHYIFV